MSATSGSDSQRNRTARSRVAGSNDVARAMVGPRRHERQTRARREERRPHRRATDERTFAPRILYAEPREVRRDGGRGCRARDDERDGRQPLRPVPGIGRGADAVPGRHRHRDEEPRAAGNDHERNERERRPSDGRRSLHGARGGRRVCTGATTILSVQGAGRGAACGRLRREDRRCSMELLRLAAVLARRRFVVVESMALFTLVAVLVALFAPRTYTASARVLIAASDTTASILTDLDLAEIATGMTAASKDIENHIALATTRPVLEEVIWRLQLRDGNRAPVRFPRAVRAEPPREIHGPAVGERRPPARDASPGVHGIGRRPRDRAAARRHRRRRRDRDDGSARQSGVAPRPRVRRDPARPREDRVRSRARADRRRGEQAGGDRSADGDGRRDRPPQLAPAHVREQRRGDRGDAGPARCRTSARWVVESSSLRSSRGSKRRGSSST